MDLHQRKSGRIALPGTDLNVRSCIPAFYPPGKQSCSLPSKQLQVQDALIPIQHSSCSTQIFSFDQGPPPPPPPPPPQMIAHEALTQHQDIEYITLPVYKNRKNEPQQQQQLPPQQTQAQQQQHYNQHSDLSILDGRFHQDSNATLDLRTIQNLSYSAVPEPGPHPSYFCLTQAGMRPRNPIHQEAQKFMAFQPPPRSPRKEPAAARALVSQHNTQFAGYAEKEFDGKGDDALYYPKSLVMSLPGRRPSSEIQLPIPFQWVEVSSSKQKMGQGALMKPIPEKVESSPPPHPSSFRKCQDYEMFPDKQQQQQIQILPETEDRQTIFKQRQLHDSYLYSANKKFSSDSAFNKLSSTPASTYKLSKKKCFHKYESKSGGEYPKKKFSGNRSENARDGGGHPEAYLSPLNFSTTSHSSLDSLSHYSSQRNRTAKNVKCTCSEDSDRLSSKKSRRSKMSPKSMYSVGNQTDFLKSPLEEKFLFRETILFGCDEIGKWARKLPMVSDIAEMGDYIREKTTQSRAQNICSALGLEIEDQVIVSGYLKVFLKVADSWLEARNCFGLTDNCMRKACQLNSPEISQNYLEWQHASRRLLGNIIHGIGSVLAPKDATTVATEADDPGNYPNLFNFAGSEAPNGASKVDCRLTRSASNLQKFYNARVPANQGKRPFLQRQKWTISDTASTTSQCSSGIRGTSQGGEVNPTQLRYYQPPPPAVDPAAQYSPECHPVLISDLPQHKITPLSQIEPPCLRKQDNSCPTVDISAWFAGKSGDAASRCVSSLSKDGSVGVGRFGLAPSQPTQVKPPPKAMNPCPKPMAVQKSQSVTVVYAANEGSQDSSDDLQQKIYMKPGSYNVPKKKLTNAKKRNNVQKAKESCCGDTEIPCGYVIPFVNAGPFVPPPSRGLQNPNIKIVKNMATQQESLMDMGFKSEENLKIITKSKMLDEDKGRGGYADKETEEGGAGGKSAAGPSKQSKVPSKTMKTDEWILTTLINSQALRPQLGKAEDADKGGKAVDMDKNKDKGQDTGQGSQGLEQSQSQASSDKSSHGVEESITNRSQSSAASRSVGKSSKGNKSIWHNSKRRRVLSQRTFLRIEEVVGSLWNCDMPEYIKQAVKAPQHTDYYKIVKYPVFLETITNKVKNGIYETVEQFVHDCRRLIFNSSLYFEKDKMETEKIDKFSEYLDKVMQETFENWECWNHITGDPREVHFYPELRYSNGCGMGKKRSKTPKNGSRKDEKLYD